LVMIYYVLNKLMNIWSHIHGIMTECYYKEHEHDSTRGSIIDDHKGD